MTYERPAQLPLYWVQTRAVGKPWRVVVRVRHLERALTWFHRLRQEARHAGVRVVHDGRVIQAVESALQEEP